MRKLNLILFLFALNCFFAFTGLAQTTAFTYQGRLTEMNAAANGTYQMQFSLHSADSGTGNQIGTTVTNNSVQVSQGVFTVQLNFTAPNAFDGGARWLEISVKKTVPVDGDYIVLAPRQQILSSPYAIRTLSAVIADNATQLENNLKNVGTLNASSNPVDWTQLKNVPSSVAAGNTGFIQNTASQQSSANFNIDGTGRVGELRVSEPSGGTHFSGLKTQAQNTDITYTLPPAVPTSTSQILRVQNITGNNATLAWGAVPNVPLVFPRIVISNINSPYQAQATDGIIGVDVTAGPVTVNLPSANSVVAGKVIVIKNEAGTAATNNITIQRSGTDLINQSSTQVVINSGTATGSFMFYSDGISHWHQI